MKILMAASEMTPFAKSGGLGDVIDALPAQLAKDGHDVCVALPYYNSVRDYRGLKPSSLGIAFDIHAADHVHRVEVLEAIAHKKVQLFFIKNDHLFARDELYGGDGVDYADNAERFIVFAKAIVELARRLEPVVDVVHVHDWQAALVATFIKAQGLPIKSVLTIHNLAYQGIFPGADFRLTNLAGHLFSDMEFYGNINFLKAGILHADTVTTVSEVYARDILTPALGCGLDGVLRQRGDRVQGILNGIDTKTWNPGKDDRIAKNYRASAPGGKAACREDLLKKLKLHPEPEGPVFMMISRLAEQKGFDLLFPILDRLLSDDVRLIIVGEGDFAYEAQLTAAMRKYRGKLAYRHEFSSGLAHLVQAGADICLSPSRFEPCGLTAMVALRYGTIPVAHGVGGLFQMIRNYEPGEPGGNGILFFDYRPEAFWDAIVRAKKLFSKTKQWKSLVKSALESDYSWSRSIPEYEKLYSSVIEG